MKVFKETFPITDEFTLMLPEDSYILKADMQGDVPCLWFLCDPSSEKIPHSFRLAGTGHEIDGVLEEMYFNWRATFQQGPFVWHLFDITLRET